jgi:hypothetical protein
MKKQLDSANVYNGMFINNYNALTGLINNSSQAQSLASKLEFNFNDLSYLKEFCTVKMYGSRRTGHTTAMCKVAYEYFDKVAILGFNYDMAEKLSGLFFSPLIKDDKNIIKHNKMEIITTNGYYLFGSKNSLDRFRGWEIEAVFIDVACMLKPKEEKEIYRVFAPCMCNHSQKFFVFIQ